MYRWSVWPSEDCATMAEGAQKLKVGKQSLKGKEKKMRLPFQGRDM